MRLSTYRKDRKEDVDKMINEYFYERNYVGIYEFLFISLYAKYFSESEFLWFNLQRDNRLHTKLLTIKPADYEEKNTRIP